MSKKLQNYLDDNKNNMKEGHYLKLCNINKDIYEGGSTIYCLEMIIPNFRYSGNDCYNLDYNVFRINVPIKNSKLQEILDITLPATIPYFDNVIPYQEIIPLIYDLDIQVEPLILSIKQGQDYIMND